MKSKHNARTIKHIVVSDNGDTYRVTFSDNWFQNINKHETPRRWVACKRLIEMNVWSVFGRGGGNVVYTPAPVVQYVPTLAESFAMAAVQGFKELDPSSVSHFEMIAGYYESLALTPQVYYDWNPIRHNGNIRKAILYRFYARSLIKGHADYDAILAAYEGIDL